MKKKRIKIIVYLCLLAVLFAVGVTALHHHVRNANSGYDCKTCAFINMVNTAILPIVLLLWLLAILKAVIVIFGKIEYSKSVKAYSSRAPPYIRA